MKDDDALVIPNRHTPSCGRLPDWAKKRPDGAYFGYFENLHGEQWVLVATREKVLLAGGDSGWDHTFTFASPEWDRLTKHESTTWPADLILSNEEREWLSTCVLAAKRRFAGP